ncbi:MAG: GAF domain-containing protein [Candidatus Alcyoniella australis]|nr:GAF domain-containing protein [Candidatus Alcyoniella australis]
MSSDSYDKDALTKALAEHAQSSGLTKNGVKSGQLVLLHDLTILVSSATDLRIVLQRALQGAVHLTDAEAGSILLRDENTDELVFVEEVGPVGVIGMRLKPGEGITGIVVERGIPEIVDNTTEDDRHSRKVSRQTGYPTRNLLAVPLRAHRNIFGAIEVINKNEGSFTQTDVYLLQALASTIAIAVQNARLYSSLEQIVQQSIDALIQTIDFRDRYTGAHTRRVTYYASIYAKQLGLPRQSFEDMTMAAVLHDIGKLGVADKILGKRATLTPEEYEVMKTHCVYGERILSRIDRFKRSLPGVRSHHEQWNGRGYPDGLSGTQIPLIARIISVADTFDAMTTTRPYRMGKSTHEAADELKKLAGNQLDPRLVGTFIHCLKSGDIRVNRGDYWVPEAMEVLTSIPPMPFDFL